MTSVFLETPIDSFTTSKRRPARFTRGKQLDILSCLVESLPVSVLMLHLKFLLNVGDGNNTYDNLWTRLPWSTIIRAYEKLPPVAIAVVVIGILPAEGCDADESDTIIPLRSAQQSYVARELQRPGWSVGTGTYSPLS